MNKYIKQIPFVKRIVKKNGFVIFFLSCFLLDYIFCVTIFYRCFDKELTKKSFIFFSHILYYYTMIIYLFLLLKDPSQTNISKIKSENSEIIIPEELLKQYNRNCNFCEEKNPILKFERASHCKACKKCILRRDHHCVFTNKCVGYHNLQLFVNFNIWLMIFGIHYYIGFIKYYKHEESLNIFIIIRILINILGIITTIVFVFVFKLVFNQIFYGLNDFTLYETLKNQYIEKYYVICDKKDSSEDSMNQYNKGWLFNWKVSIGPTIFHLFFPLPINFKYDFYERDKTFNKVARYKDRRIIKKLSEKRIFDTLENIIHQEYEKSNPVVFMENVRQIYKNYEII